MSNAVFLIAAYVIVVVGLALYAVNLWRQQANLADRLSATMDGRMNHTEDREQEVG